MLLHCVKCNKLIEDTAEKCPYCGAINSHKQTKKATGYCKEPSTMLELQDWVTHHRIPTDEMRVFIGGNYSGAKLTGIYKDDSTGEFVLYRLKSNGNRVEDYRGSSEELAVSEMYRRIKSKLDENKGKASYEIDWDEDINGYFETSLKIKKRRPKNILIWAAVAIYIFRCGIKFYNSGASIGNVIGYVTFLSFALVILVNVIFTAMFIKSSMKNKE